MDNFLSSFTDLPEKLNLPQEEEKVLEFWERVDAFHKQLEKTKGQKPYTFYDGPPFATGTPHYGHLCTGTIKDVMTRYASQTGHHVERRFGWDCHGLPVEDLVNKTSEPPVTTREQVYEMGVKTYNDRCRATVTKFRDHWKKTVTRSGRWIDFENDYKTMDFNYMESVWWVFKQLWDNNRVYQGFRVMPYSVGCSTVVSLNEASQNQKLTQDLSAWVQFPLKNQPDTSLVAWTTTPWTLPSNLVLTVKDDFKYVTVVEKATGKKLMMADFGLSSVFESEDLYSLLPEETKTGKELEGLEYEPLFKYYEQYKERGAFRVYCGKFVTDDKGTGVVHTAPAFGQDDYELCTLKGVVDTKNLPDPVDANGYFTLPVTDFVGKWVKDKETDEAVVEKVKQMERLVKSEMFEHNYPFCWRSGKPLVYKAVSAWFVKVEDCKEKLKYNNSEVNWVPSSLGEKDGKVDKLLDSAPDWCVSRNRFWGNPMPVWVSDDMTEKVCVGSVAELEELSGVKGLTDLHKDTVDSVTIPSKQGKGVLRRVEEVFDCWVESASMPFAQLHYPFEMSDEEFDKRYPADFVGEGLDQTRCWFYYMNVLGTALRGQTPYKNVVVNGIVLDKNGKKLSKKDKNYPDPDKLFDKVGADPTRLYLLNSPLVRADNLRFDEEDVKKVVQSVFLPWFNATKFLVQSAQRWEEEVGKSFKFDEQLVKNMKNLNNPMDRWLVTCCQELVKFVRQEMDNYRLYTVVSELLKFLENLTNCYVKLNRNRLKGENGAEDQLVALNVLFNVLLDLTLLLSPFVPFFSEMVYQHLKGAVREDCAQYYEESVHFLTLPTFNPDLCEPNLKEGVTLLQQVLQDARNLRVKKGVSVKQPLKSLTLVTDSERYAKLLSPFFDYVKSEINVAEVSFDFNLSKYSTFYLKPNMKELNLKYREDFTKEFKQALNEKLTPENTQLFMKDKKLEVYGQVLDEQFLMVKPRVNEKVVGKDELYGGESEVKSLLNFAQDENLKMQGKARELKSNVQQLRKDSGLSFKQKVTVFVKFDADKSPNFKKLFEQYREQVQAELKRPLLNEVEKPKDAKLVAEKVFKLENEEYTVLLCSTSE